MAIITVTNNVDMITLSSLWNFAGWGTPPVDNLDGTWTVPNEYVDSITAALANIDSTILAKNAADAENAITSTGMTTSQLLSVMTGLIPAPITNTPPVVTPPKAMHVAIAEALTGVVNITAGHVFNMGGGVALWVFGPVPTVLGGTGNISIPIPTFTHPISVTGMVLNHLGTQWWNIGSSQNGLVSNINTTLDPTTNMLTLTADTSNWQISGYLAFTYIP